MTDHSHSEPVQLEDVFIPTQIPERTFVERPEVGDRLAKHLRSKGRPICLVGPYRSGKTTLALTLIRRSFAHHVHIVCQKSSTFDQILLEAFDSLDASYLQESNLKDSRLPTGLSADVLGVKGQIGGKTTETTARQQRVVSPQRSARALAGFAAAGDAPLVIDDVHKLAPEELTKVAEAMREWQTLVLEKGVAKMVVIGTEQFAASLPKRLIAAAPDLRQRMVDVTITLMSPEELRQIVTSGARLLNVDFSQIIEQIVKYSFGFPGVCQDLCLQTTHAAGVDMTADSTVTLTPNHLRDGLSAYLKDCDTSIKFAFAEILANPPAGLPAGYTKVVLDTVAAGALDGVEIEKLVNSTSKSLDISKIQAQRGLEYLTDDEHGVLRSDLEASRIHFREPMYLVYYQQGSGSAVREADQQALLTKFLEAIRRR